MELKVFWRTLGRRWYLTLVVLALTVGATTYIVGSVGPTYEAEGSALVFPPASSTKSEGTTKAVGNPYLELAGVAQARDVVIRTLKSRSEQTDWGDRFPGMSYEATPDFTNSAPIILFTVEGDTSEGSAAALDDLMARVPVILGNLQNGLGLPQDGFVTARKLTQDTRPAVVRKTQIRAGLLVAAVSGGLGLLLLALVDSLLGVRARNAAERAAAREQAREEEEWEEELEDAYDDLPPPDPEHEPEPDPELEPALVEEPEPERVLAEESEPAEDSEKPHSVYPYLLPEVSEVAVSPARSKWLRSSAPGAANGSRGEPGDLMGLNGSRTRAHGSRALAATPSRTRDSGRNR